MKPHFLCYFLLFLSAVFTELKCQSRGLESNLGSLIPSSLVASTAISPSLDSEKVIFCPLFPAIIPNSTPETGRSRKKSPSDSI